MGEAVPLDRRDWVRPGAYRAAPDVYRIPLRLPDPALAAVNVYVVLDGDGAVLVDSGWQGEPTTTQLATGLRELGLSYSDVREVLMTHVHRDHYSEAMTIRRLAGTRIRLGEGERPKLEAVLSNPPGADFGYFDYLRSLGAGPLVSELEQDGYAPSGYSGEWELPDAWLGAAETIELRERGLRVVATPGHTRGHVVFADLANRLVFAGDHVLPHITPSIGLEPASPELPLGDYLRSLDLMLRLPDCTLLPAHGAPGGSVHARVAELLDHHAARLRSTAATAATGGTPLEVAQALSWTARQRSFADLAPFHRMLAVAETAAHLDVLVSRGELARSRAAGVWTYTAEVDASISCADRPLN